MSGGNACNRRSYSSQNAARRYRRPGFSRLVERAAIAADLGIKAHAGFWFDALEEITSKVTLDLGCFANAKDGLCHCRDFTNVDLAYPARRTKPLSGDKYRLLAIGRLTNPFAVWLRK